MAHVDSCVRIHEDLVRNSSKREREIKDVPITGNQSSSHVTEFNAIIINEFRCYEAKIEESEKSRQSPGVEPRTPLA